MPLPATAALVAIMRTDALIAVAPARLKLENVLPWRNSLEGVAQEKDRSAKANDPADGDAAASGTSPS